MTQRERVLATTLLVLMAVIGGGVFFHMFVYEPISEVREQLEAERTTLTKNQNELAQEQRVIGDVFHVNPRLVQWQKISLPPADPELKKKVGISLEEKKKIHLRQLQVAYVGYLDGLLRNNGFEGESILISVHQADRRSSPTLKAKEPVYERLAFSVTGRGKLQAVTAALKAFHTTPLLQQIRSMSVAVAPPRGQTPIPGLLELHLTVEALLVNGAEERTALLPAKIGYQPVVLADTGRSYDLMVKRSMFTGITASTKKDGSTAKVSVDMRNEVLRFVKLTMLFYNPDRLRWEATLYDQAKGGNETKLNERILNEIKINDGNDTEVLDARVMKIDETQLIFRVDGKCYRMNCGDFIYPAIRQPLSSKELETLGISPGS